MINYKEMYRRLLLSATYAELELKNGKARSAERMLRRMLTDTEAKHRNATVDKISGPEQDDILHSDSGEKLTMRDYQKAYFEIVRGIERTLLAFDNKDDEKALKLLIQTQEQTLQVLRDANDANSVKEE